MSRFTVHQGDALTVLRGLPERFAHCAVTSPPYYKLRDYQAEGQLGQERTVEAYIASLVAVFREVRRCLRPDATLWVNVGDSYCRSDNQARLLKKGDMMGVPWQLALALRDDGWYLRSSIIWHKLNACPESVVDRPTQAHEYVFLFSASRRYYYDQAAIREPVTQSTLKRHRTAQRACIATQDAVYTPDARIKRVNPKYRDTSSEDIAARGRNKRTVWTTACASNRGAVHRATYPEALITPCVLAGCPKGGVVLDPFAGSGTTGLAALRHGRDFVGVELNAEYTRLAEDRLRSFASA